MVEKEKLKREEVLKILEIPDDTLSSYEQELEITSLLDEDLSHAFSSDDVDSIKVLHKLLRSGMSKTEVKLLASFSEILRNIDIDSEDAIKSLLSLSPVYRLKQSLNVAREELQSLRQSARELEERLYREIEVRAQIDKDSISVRAELEAKEKTLENLDKKLAETLLQKAHLESQLSVTQPQHTSEQKSTSGLTAQTPIKGKKAKELSEIISQKDLEITDLKKQIENLTSEIQSVKNEKTELTERLELMEDDISEIEQEIETRYQEQIKTIREQVEGLVEAKQKEWDSFFTKSSDQHRQEILTIQEKHEAQILELNKKIEEQEIELELLRSGKNPLTGIFKKKTLIP